MEHRNFKSFHLLLFSLFFRLALSYQDGFLSLSCGGTMYYLDSSNISWRPDRDYVSTGNISTVIFQEGTSSTQLPLRFFPDSLNRNCYRLPIQNTSSNLVLIRTKFVYKNFDGLNNPPIFFVSIGTATVATINLTSIDPWIEEFVWPTADKEVLPLCFHSINGFPVISSLELRPLPQGAYRGAFGDSTEMLLKKSYRINCGYCDGSLRYPLDEYDRIWDADEDFSPFHVSSSFDIQSYFNISNIKENPPVSVLQTGRVLARQNNLIYNLPLNNLRGDYHVVLYFAGILPVDPTFDVLVNGEVVQSNYSVSRWEANVLFFNLKGIDELNITLKTIKYYPLINALEVYEVLDIPLESSSTTVSALRVIQDSTGLDFGWQDDPCSPMPWQHVDCEGNLVTSLKLFDVNLRTISPTFGDLLDLKTLDLHNTSLAGEIQNLGGLQHLQILNLSFNEISSFGSDLEDLINIQVLDLQNNSLQGTVPESLGELNNLHLLNLENNKLQGPLPQALNRESLNIRASGNLCLSFTLTCTELSRNPPLQVPQVTIFTPKKHKNSHIAILLGALGGTLVILFVIITFSILLYTKRKKSKNTYAPKSEMDMSGWNSAKIFTYKEIKTTTNNFKEPIGRGSFGCVYVGKLHDGKQVAVKVRFDKSQMGADSFINEVSLLSQIRHQNLVTLEGFCCESKQQILVYEYLSGGSLADNIYGAKSKKLILSWVRRLKIAVDAAKGLDYLHNGNELRIIHRDVKSSNILLDKDLNAKVCDFGLSKQVTQADASHVTTIVKGTAGYLDPEYYITQQLTEKSDVYSFGVVLLELICGREPLTHSGSPDSFNLVLWAKPYLQANAFEIVDENIKGTFDAESMRRASLIACRSVERDAMCRPRISQVLAELKEAYSIQLAYLASSDLVN